MRTTLALLALLLTAITTTVQAQCTRPKPDFQVLQGKTATEQQMLDVQKKLVAYDGQVGEYLRCLKGEASQQQVGKDEAGKQKVPADYSTAHNSIADEVAGFADCFNAELEAFQQSGGGTQPQPADCSGYIAKAGSTASSTGPRVPAGLVKEADGHSVELPTGVWSFSLIRDDTPRRCAPNSVQACLTRTVYVLNGSSESLECTGVIEYEGANHEGRTKIEARAVVLDKSARSLVTSAAPTEVNAKTFDATCTPRAKLPPLDTPATCKYEVVKPVTVADYYPPESQKIGEEGPVVVEFSVGDKAANPTNVKAVASSLMPRLDEAAVKAVSNMVMSSNCKKGRYRLRLNFQLEQ